MQKDANWRLYIDTVVRESFPSDDMRKYFESSVSRVVELDDGDLYAIEKPRIETHFCFGYGMYGGSSEDAWNQARKASNDGGEYFKNENLHNFDRHYSDINGDRYVACVRKKYSSAPKDSKVVDIQYLKEWEITNEDEWKKNGKFRRLSDREKEKIMAAVAEERLAFEKRLNTYLKRYGTEKLRMWAYWEDA